MKIDDFNVLPCPKCGEIEKIEIRPLFINM